MLKEKLNAQNSDRNIVQNSDQSYLKDSYKNLPIKLWTKQNDSFESKQDNIAQECPVALIYNGISHAVMMASPFDLKDFALGFSLSESIITKASQIYSIEISTQKKGIEVNINISAERMMALKKVRRNLIGRTGCGLCGSESLEQAMRPIKQVTQQTVPTSNAIQTALSQLEFHQKLQQLTGAAHGAAWCNTNGEIKLLREDVGRHNALDKLIGLLTTEKVNTNNGFILISSRASYEMVQKTCSVNVGSLVAVSAPTALAIELATNAKLNLIGFARRGRYIIYTQLKSGLT